MALLRVRHDWATSLSLFTFMHWRRKWQPTPVFLPGESQGWEAWWAAVYGVAQSPTQLKRRSSSINWRASSLPCPRDTWQCLETFPVVTTWGCYCHLMSRGQGCCKTSYSAQNSPTTKESPSPKIFVTSAKIKKPWDRPYFEHCLPLFT